MDVRISGSAFAALCLAACSAAVMAEESPGDSLLPDFYNDSTLSTSGIRLEDYENSSVDYFSGMMSRSATDFSVPGNGGMALGIQRGYQSLQPYSWPERTAVGVGWNMHFGWLEISDQGKMCNALWSVSVMDNPVLHMPDGSTDVLALSGLPMGDPNVPHYRGKGGMGLICGALPAGGTLAPFVVVTADGTRYEFEQWSAGGSVTGFNRTAKWFVKRVVDRHGNWLWIDYANVGGSDTVVAPVRVTASDGRDVFFDYEEGLLRRIRYGGEVVAEYAYVPSGAANGFHDLAQVTLREGLTWQYAYSSRSDAGAGSMVLATNPFGGTTAYTWQQLYFQTGDDKQLNASVVQVVQDAAGSPPATWSYSYAPAELPGERDVTTVMAPEGTYTYTHFSALGMVSGEVWKVGLKERVVFEPGDGGAMRTEEFTWQPYLVSTENYKRTRASGLYAAVDEAYYGSTVAAHKTTIGSAEWHVTNSQWVWSSSHLGQPGAQLTVLRGPDGNERRLNKRFHHRPAIHVYFLVHQEWVTQALFPQNTPVQTDFNELGDPVKKFDRGFYTFFTYDEQGNLATMTRGTSADGTQGTPRITRHGDYYRGVARETIHPDQTVTRREVDDLGRALAVTNREGKTSRYAYDGLGRVTLIDYPRGNDTQVTYQARVTTLQRGNYRKTTRIDGFGRTVEESHQDTVSGRAITVVRDHDEQGRVIFTSYPNSTVQGMRYSYDDYGRVTRVLHAGGERSYSYREGDHVALTDENNNVTRLYRDEIEGPGKGELVRVESPEGVVTRMARNEYGLPLRIEQGDGTNMLARTNTYSASLVLLSSVEPESGETRYGYDYAGNLTHIMRDDGVAGTVDNQYNSYDLNDRVTTTWAPTNELVSVNGARESWDARLEFTWTAEGKPVDQSRHETVTRRQDGVIQFQELRSSTWHHEYDDNGNPVLERASVDGHEKRFAYQYDGNDRLEAMAYPDGHVLAYAPDAFGWPTRAGNHATGVQYHETGQLAGFTYGNGRQMVLSVNDRFLVAGISVPGLVDLGYAYDAAGNVRAISDHRDNTESVALAYDGMNRMITANGPWGSGTFGYDHVGNIRQKNVGADQLVLSYDATNRLSGLGGSRNRTFGYDGFGNISRRDGTLFGYDGLGNLMAVKPAVESTTVAYQYDARGRRIATHKGGTISYTLQANGDRLLYEFEPVDGNWKRNIYLGSIQVARSESYVACFDDLDGDGIPHCVEQEAGMDPRDGTDAAGDRDRDGLTNLQEYQRGTGINDADTDDDGMPDGVEVLYGLDPRVNDADGDLDGDGLPNSVELARGFNPSNPADGAADADADGLSNAAEYVLGTAWNDADSDNDGMPDGYEAGRGLDPLRHDGGADLDGDGMSNRFEFDHGFDPASPGDGAQDADGDGLSNAAEYVAATNPRHADTDGDGISDGVELANGLNPRVADADDDRDGDGMPNRWELDHGFDPNNVVSEAWDDPDGDGLNNLQEYQGGTDPHVADTLAPVDTLYAMAGGSTNFLDWERGVRDVTYAVDYGVVGETEYIVGAGQGDAAFFAHRVPADTLYWYRVRVRAGMQEVVGARTVLFAGEHRDTTVSALSAQACVDTSMARFAGGGFYFACAYNGGLTVQRYADGRFEAPLHLPTTGLNWQLAANRRGDAIVVWVDATDTLRGTRYDVARRQWGAIRGLEDVQPGLQEVGYSFAEVGYVTSYRAVMEEDGHGQVYYAYDVPYTEFWNAGIIERVSMPQDGVPPERKFLLYRETKIIGITAVGRDDVLLVTGGGGRPYNLYRRFPVGSVVDFGTGVSSYKLPSFDRGIQAWTNSSVESDYIVSGHDCDYFCRLYSSADAVGSGSSAPVAFGGGGNAQVFWRNGTSLQYIRAATNRKGVVGWTEPVNIVSDNRMDNSNYVRLLRSNDNAYALWSQGSGTDVRLAALKADGSWSAPAVIAAGRLVDAAADWAGNISYVVERDGQHEFRERSRLPGTTDWSDDPSPPVLVQSSTRSGKATVKHVVTLSADDPANLFFRVSGGTVTAGGVNTSAEQRYKGPVTITFPKGGSATITYRGINMAERWSASVSRVLQ